MPSSMYGSIEGENATLTKTVIERDRRQDRVLAFFILTTMVLLITTLVMSILLIGSFHCKPRIKQIKVQLAEVGEYPPKLASLNDFENYCKKNMDYPAYTYFSGASMTKTTKNLNRNAFHKIGLRPKHLVNVSNVQDNIGTEVFSDKISFPVGISPTAYHKWAHPEGELATARAAQTMSVVYIASIHSTTTMEDIRKAAPNAVLWQQTYIFADRNLTMDFIHRAEKAHFSAIVITIDKVTDNISWNKKRGLISWPEDLIIENFADPNKSIYARGSTWEDIRDVIDGTSIPVVLKGVTTAEDAKMALDVGAEGVLVSNHGGRVLDFLPATIDILDEVVAAVEGKIDVFLDGGVRTGPDVFKAIAKGAKMVFLGRPVLYGLGYDGKRGVEQVLQILKDEFINTMILAGSPTLVDITKERLQKAPIDICLVK